MAKFESAKVGERVWDIIKGEWGRITKIYKNLDYPLVVFFKSGGCRYTLDGQTQRNERCRLFWNEVRLPSAEEDKKPFKLVEYLEENIKPKKFNGTDKNWCFYYDTIFKHFESGAHSNFQIVGTVYFTEEDIKKVIPKLEEEKITSEQLRQAFKELGWL